VTILIGFFYVLAVLAAYLAVVAVVVVLSDGALRPKQKVIQCLVSILVPVLGPLTILFMTHTVNS
jgi:hypothetical protein